MATFQTNDVISTMYHAIIPFFLEGVGVGVGGRGNLRKQFCLQL